MGDRRRVLAWFSAGDASAVATKLALKRHGDAVVIVRAKIDSEHPDNDRFAADCAKWYGREITEIRSEKYATHWDVIEQRRFISGPSGALCTVELKKIPRFAFQRVDDLHVFGYTADAKDANRADRLREQNPEIAVEFPLIDAGLTKSDCHAIVMRAGIKRPAMYDLGFENNNCIACSKATSATYWNRVRRHFPPQFERMARAQRMLDYTQVKLNGSPIFLDELPPTAGTNEAEPDIDCSLLCVIAEMEIA